VEGASSVPHRAQVESLKRLAPAARRRGTDR